MELYQYYLSEKYPTVFETCKLPTRDLPVRYDGKLCCITSISESGLVGLDLPKEAIEKIENKLARIRHISQVIPEAEIGDDGMLHQLVRIDVETFL